MEEDIDTDLAKNVDKKAKKKSCFKVIGIIVAIIIFLYFIPRVIYLASYQNSSAKTSNNPTPVKQTSSPSPNSVKNNQSGSASSEPASSGSASKDERHEETTVNDDSNNKDIIDYFIETAVLDSSDREMFVTRWTASSISVGVGEGEFNDNLNNCLSSFIDDFNTQSSSVKLHRDDTVDLGVPNIKIYYWNDAEFKQKAGSDIQYGLTQWNHKEDKSLQRSMVFISKDIMNNDESVRCQVIRHEMMHAVGFWGHSNKFFEGIMALPKTRYIYPEHDKQIVRMLYNSGVAIGSKVENARSYLEQNKNW